jgi:hypothetical protein
MMMRLSHHTAMAKNNGRSEAKSVKQTPAQAVMDIFDGASNLARLLKCDPSRVYRWNMPISRKGTGGRIPSKAMRQITELAKQHNKTEITAEVLVNGRVVPTEGRSAA